MNLGKLEYTINDDTIHKNNNQEQLIITDIKFIRKGLTMTSTCQFLSMTIFKRRRRKIISSSILLVVIFVSMTTTIINSIFVVQAFTSIAIRSAYLFPKKHCNIIVTYANNRDSFLEDTPSNNNNNNNNNNKGYRFGDFTRGALNRFQGRVKSLTGKESYEFGDLSRFLDSKAKETVTKFTNKDDYKFGDITKEIVRRLVDGEYSRDDLLLLLKIAATIGINMQPVAQILPIKVLLDLLNLSLEASVAQTVSEKVISSISNEIDARMKEMVTGDRNYQIGDLTKRAVARWTGKEYEFGDVTKTILRRIDDREENNIHEDKVGLNSSLELDEAEESAIEAWDKEFLEFRREQEGLTSLNNDDKCYQEWDKQYLESQQSSADQIETSKD